MTLTLTKLRQQQALQLRVLRRLTSFQRDGLDLKDLADLANVDELQTMHDAGLLIKTSDNKRLLISDKGRTMLASARRI